MIDVIQWRSTIGLYNNGRPSRTSITKDKTTQVSSTNMKWMDIMRIMMRSISVVIVILMLLVLSGDVETNPGPLGGSKVDVNTAYKFLKPISAEWDDIRRGLGLDVNFQKVLMQHIPQLTPEQKLERVLDEWIQSICSEVSWKNLIEVLHSENLVKTARTIEEYVFTTSHTPGQGLESNEDTSGPVSQGRPPDLDHKGQFQLQCNADSPLPRYTSSSIPECVKPFRHYLQGRYATSEFPSYFKYPSPSIPKFINLLVVPKKISATTQRNLTMQLKLRGYTADIKRNNRTITIDEITAVDLQHDEQNMQSQKHCRVLIEGDPGVGKTTLAWELCKGWAEGRLLCEWTIVLLVQLRDSDVRQSTTLQSLIDPYNEYPGLCDHIQSTQGERLLMIFDGFDELSEPQREQTSFLMRLLDKKTLTRASFIVTSRPLATQSLPEIFIKNLDQHIEVIGFEDDDIERYIKCKFKHDKSTLDAFKEYISSHHFIYTLMYVPLHCALVTDLYSVFSKEDEREFVPKTITQLYTIFICCLIQRNKEQRKFTIIEDLPLDSYTELLKLAELAANGILNKQYVFDNIQGNLETFGLLQRVNTFHSYSSDVLSYSFLHLTLQEYLAAYYWFKNPHKVQSLFDEDGALPIKRYFCGIQDESLHWPAFHFYCGLTGVIGTCLVEHLLEKPGEYSVDYNWYYMLFESQSVELISKLMKPWKFIEKPIESHMEAYMNGYCIARADDMEWHLAMDSRFMKNLVNGVQHARLPDVKGGVIQEFKIVQRNKDECDVFLFLKYVESIRSYVNSLRIKFTIHESLERFTQVDLTHGFSLDEFIILPSSSAFCFIRNEQFMIALFSILSKFKTLTLVSLEGLGYYERFLADTFVDSDGLHIKIIKEDGQPFTCSLNLIRSAFIQSSLQCEQSSSTSPLGIIVPKVSAGIFRVILSNNRSLMPQESNIVDYFFKCTCMELSGINSFVCQFNTQGHFALRFTNICLHDSDFAPIQLNTCTLYVHCNNKWFKIASYYCNDHSSLPFINIHVNRDNIEFVSDILKRLPNLKSVYCIGDSEYIRTAIVKSETDSSKIINDIKLAISLELGENHNYLPINILLRPPTTTFTNAQCQIFHLPKFNTLQFSMKVQHCNSILQKCLQMSPSEILGGLSIDLDLIAIEHKSLAESSINAIIQLLSLCSEIKMSFSHESKSIFQKISDGVTCDNHTLKVLGIAQKLTKHQDNYNMSNNDDAGDVVQLDAVSFRRILKHSKSLKVLQLEHQFDASLLDADILHEVIKTAKELTHIIITSTKFDDDDGPMLCTCDYDSRQQLLNQLLLMICSLPASTTLQEIVLVHKPGLFSSCMCLMPTEQLMTKMRQYQKGKLILVGISITSVRNQHDSIKLISYKEFIEYERSLKIFRSSFDDSSPAIRFVPQSYNQQEGVIVWSELPSPAIMNCELKPISQHKLVLLNSIMC